MQVLVLLLLASRAQRNGRDETCSSEMRVEIGVRNSFDEMRDVDGR